MFIGAGVIPSIYGENEKQKESIKPIEQSSAPSSTTDTLPMFHHDLTQSGYSPFHTSKTNTILSRFQTNRFMSSSHAEVDTKIADDSFEREMNFVRGAETITENSLICGYVTNALTEDPVVNADVFLHWNDSQGNELWNNTLSNDSGYYQISVAAGTVDLYFSALKFFPGQVDDFIVGENETIWINTSLAPYPTENSIVCGYIVDAVTAEPIENANIHLYWRDNENHYLGNDTSTDHQGFYQMNVGTGIIDLHVYMNGYFDWYFGEHEIGEGVLFWVNVSLFPIPPETSVICGYITDDSFSNPLIGAQVQVYWRDDLGHGIWNTTLSNDTGFYRMNVAMGTLELHVWIDGYFSEEFYGIGIDENETLWFNVSMTQYPVENSAVQGYVLNAITMTPIMDAHISLEWRDDKNHELWNDTMSDVYGFYRMNVSEGSIHLSASANGYLSSSTDWFTIESYQLIWVNFTLEPDSEPPNISNIIVPAFVGMNNPGDISIDVNDDHLTEVDFFIMDDSLVTFNQSALIIYYMNTTGISGRCTLENYRGCYWNMSQEQNFSPVINVFLSVPYSSNASANPYVYALFKKNQTSDLKEVFLEFNIHDGSLINMTRLNWSSLEITSINDEIESGISIIYPLTVFETFGIPYTLYSIGNSLNPFLTQVPLNNGTYLGNIWAWDKVGHNADASFNVTVLQLNAPPLIPTNPIPASGATGIDIHTDLSWTSGDPDPGDTVTYDVYFGNTSSPLKKVSNQTGTTYDPGTLSYEQTYYWKIVAWDNHHASVAGPIWHFTTISQPDTTPPVVTITKPEKAIYFNNKKILTFSTTIIIKSITIEVNATDNESGVNRVEFFIDDVSQANDTSSPYSWTWTKAAFFRHTIKVTVYDKAGNHQSKELEVWKFF